MPLREPAESLGNAMRKSSGVQVGGFMASIHTYTQLNQAVRLYAIDHAVGYGGTNRADDVQLIQVLINRYKDWREEVFNTGSKSNSAMRVLDRAGQPIDELKVDGHCGRLTLAAILSAQRAINAWRGCAIDGRIDASREAGA